MSLKWKDAQRIAEELYDNEPDLDPVTLRLSELRERVLALPDFDDDPERAMNRFWRRFSRLGLTSVEINRERQKCRSFRLKPTF